jgi:hypothetical protein
MTHLLRGPADPDAFRVAGPRGGRMYLDHLAPDAVFRPEQMTEAVTSMSGIKNAEGKGGLVTWAAKMVAAEAVTRRDVWQAMDDDEAIGWLKDAADRNKNKAATRGTGVHEFVERLLEGRGPSVWEGPGSNYEPAIRAFVEEWRPVVRYSEIVAFGNRNGIGYGGTFDAIVELEGLGLCMIDYKSRGETANNPHSVYAGEVAQLGGYSGADYIIVEVDGVATRIAMPPLDGLALVTFTPDAYVVHPIALEPAQDVFDRLAGWWQGETLARTAVLNKRDRPRPPHAPPKTPAEMSKDELLELANGDYGLDVPKSWSKPKILTAIAAHESDMPVELLTFGNGATVAPIPPASTGEDDASTNLDEHPVDGADEAALLADLDAVRALLRPRAAALIAAGHNDTLAAAWPNGVPGITAADNYDHLRAIETVIGRVEAHAGMPFDPPASDPQPFTSEATTKAAAATPKAPGPDEGPDIGDNDLSAVRAAYGLSEPAGIEWITGLAGRAGNLSLTQRKTARRARIGYALARLACAGHHDDELLDACLRHINAYSGASDDPAPILAQMSAEKAKQLSDTVGSIISEALYYVVDPTSGDMLLADAPL